MTLRELTADEIAVLRYLVSISGEACDALGSQLSTAKTSGLSCKCGCPSIWLAVDRTLAPAPISGPVDAFGRDSGGNMVGVALLLEDGYMKEIDFTDITGTSASGAVRIPLVTTLRSALELESAPGVIDLNRLP